MQMRQGRWNVPRSIWKGSISFGLVNAPVAMYAAIDEQDLHFHMIHTKDDSPIGYDKVCKKEGKPCPRFADRPRLRARGRVDGGAGGVRL
jgi:hypothetical protein